MADPFAFLDSYRPAGAASNPELDALVRQIIARMRARLGQQPQQAQTFAAVNPMPAPAPMPTPAPLPAPAPAYTPPPQVAPAVQPAPTPYSAPPPGVPALGTGGNTPWTAAGYGGAAPTPGANGTMPDVQGAMAGMPLFLPPEQVTAPSDPNQQPIGGYYRTRDGRMVPWYLPPVENVNHAGEANEGQGSSDAQTNMDAASQNQAETGVYGYGSIG